MTLDKPDQTVEPSPVHDAAATTAAKDRRRPERLDQVSAHLVPLLRTPAVVDAPLPSNETDALPIPDDQLASAKGIAVGLVLSLPLWAIIGSIAWWVLH